jgi:paraquat-inducible protein B
MNDNQDLHPSHEGHFFPPPPKVVRKSGPSLVWLIPIITLLIGGWLIVKTVSEKGPQITITFKTAEGIEAGKTKVKYKDLEIGVVKSAAFSPDFTHVTLQVDMAKEASPFLKRNTRFWVVTPRMSLRGMTGLSTLISGAYIEIEPGEGTIQDHFVGLDAPPVVNADVAGKKITLLTKKLTSVDAGSPLYYHGLRAGEVMGYELGSDQKSILIYAFIKSPFDELVRGNTRFWNTSGIDLALGSEGVNVHTESIESLLFGGIAFETPDSLESTKEDTAGLVFTLYDDYKSSQEQAFTKKIPFVLFFDGSVRGLKTGAPVELRGIRIGTVADIRLELDSSGKDFLIPVLIEVEPERFIGTAEAADKVGSGKALAPYEIFKKLVAKGLRARLQVGSYVTGQLFIELDMHPGSPIRLAAKDKQYPELPTIPGTLEQISSAVSHLLDTLDQMKLDKVSMDLRTTLAEFNKALATFDRHAGPVAENVNQTLAAGKKTIAKLEETLSLANDTLKTDSPLQNRMIQMTDELAETARSIRIFMDLLERNPNSIIFGKPTSGEKQ